MKIELTNEMIEMEQGPNLYFMGNPAEFHRLQNLISVLCVKTGVELLLNKEISNIEVVNPNLIIVLKSKEKGSVLSKILENKVMIELDPVIWKRVYDNITLISERIGHIYLEFDDLHLEEDCNIIMSSEW